jgi:hypothetical protein
MERNPVVSRNVTVRSILVTVLVILPHVGCGGTSCSQPIKVWPPLGNVEKAVKYINERTCNILAIENGEDVFIRVGWETRGCWVAGAAKHDGYVAISVTPEDCPMQEYYRTGLVIHEILHAIGHWHHDEYPGDGPHSVMEAVLGSAGWELMDDDIAWLVDKYCE